MNKQINIGIHTIIKNKKGEVLLCKRNKKFGYDEWELPGGHLELLETFEQNIKKESMEELGIEVTVGDLVSVAPNMKYGNHYIIFTFLISSYEGEPLKKAPEEHSEIKWFDVNKLPKKLFISTKNALDNYLSGDIYKVKSS